MSSAQEHAGGYLHVPEVYRSVEHGFSGWIKSLHDQERAIAGDDVILKPFNEYRVRLIHPEELVVVFRMGQTAVNDFEATAHESVPESFNESVEVRYRGMSVYGQQDRKYLFARIERSEMLDIERWALLGAIKKVTKRNAPQTDHRWGIMFGQGEASKANDAKKRFDKRIPRRILVSPGMIGPDPRWGMRVPVVGLVPSRDVPVEH